MKTLPGPTENWVPANVGDLCYFSFFYFGHISLDCSFIVENVTRDPFNQHFHEFRSNRFTLVRRRKKIVAIYVCPTSPQSSEKCIQIRLVTCRMAWYSSVRHWDYCGPSGFFYNPASIILLISCSFVSLVVFNLKYQIFSSLSFSGKVYIEVNPSGGKARFLNITGKMIKGAKDAKWK